MNMLNPLDPAPPALERIHETTLMELAHVLAIARVRAKRIRLDAAAIDELTEEIANVVRRYNGGTAAKAFHQSAHERITADA